MATGSCPMSPSFRAFSGILGRLQQMKPEWDGFVICVSCNVSQYTKMMKKPINPKLEIGRIIRQEIIPKGMSVTEAAEKLGVSRPALSRLLNGQAALSPKMALRLKETFGADIEELLSMQGAADSESHHDQHRMIPVTRYVPDFLTITANQIEAWGMRKTHARDLLPVLVRRLVHDTGRELQHLDFPGFDNAQRHGFDGQVLAGAAALKVPAGLSVWEVSVAREPQKKAERDYKARLDKLPQTQQAESTYVFVTTWNWDGKDDWVKRKNALGEWKEVRAYDASDLEQWLETTVGPRIWLAEILRIPISGFRTIESCWKEWAMATEPQMTPAIFAPSTTRHKKKLQEWLGSPPDRPFIVAADSREEARAFIACFFLENDCLSTAPGSVVVFQSVETLKLLAGSTSPFIVVVCSDEVECGIADVFRRRHCIAVRPRNSPFGEPDIAIDPLDREAFESALSDMGIETQRLERLLRQSGLSPTVLRRRLSQVPAIQTPPWAMDPEIARKLIPMALIGAWHAGFDADQEILATLSNDPFENVKSAVTDLLRNEDCPVWRVGDQCGVVSKIDALFAMTQFVTEQDLMNFLEMAEYVLSESDPALDLPENIRWQAGLFGKVREHSPALRSGIRDTLIFLAVHGNRLFSNRLGINVKEDVSVLVNRLLTPVTSKKLESYNHDLPDLAEAAPHVFLKVLQADLGQTQPVLKPLLRPAKDGLFASPPRLGLLWALERLAWHQKHFMDVVTILADLSRTRINDNWINKPVKSLASIFHSWLPQTAVSVSDRIQALKVICKHYPDVGWQICIGQINGRNDIGEYNVRPRWRAVAAGSMTPVSPNERSEFERAALDLVVNWPHHDGRTLSHLLPCLPRIGEEEQMKVLDCVNTWARTQSDEATIAETREQIGQLVYSLDASPPVLFAQAMTRARETFQQLIPKDAFMRLALPFRGMSTYSSIAKSQDPSLDWANWPERFYMICKESFAEIWSSYGIDGVIMLLEGDCTGSTIGGHVASYVSDAQETVDIIRSCLSNDTVSSEKINDFLQGFFRANDDDTCTEVLSSLVKVSAGDSSVRVLRHAPFNGKTWQLVDQMPGRFLDEYWEKVYVPLKKYSMAEAGKLVNNLLRVGRPWDAFFALRADYDRVGTIHLRRLLKGVTASNLGQIGYSENVIYYLPKALESLSKRSGISTEEMAQLEFASIDLIPPRECNVPNLENQIEESPLMFVYLLSLVTERRSVGQDPAEWHVEDQILKRILGRRAYSLFEALRRLPGQDDNGEINLSVLTDWISEARRLAFEHGRIGICDQQIGQWLSRLPAREDAPWPSRTICKVLESICSDEVASGFSMGVFNARGSTSRRSYEGGMQEWDLAAKYRLWAEAWMIEFPFVSKIIDSIADRYERDAAREDHEAEARRRLDL